VDHPLLPVDEKLHVSDEAKNCTSELDVQVVGGCGNNPGPRRFRDDLLEGEEGPTVQELGDRFFTKEKDRFGWG